MTLFHDNRHFNFIEDSRDIFCFSLEDYNISHIDIHFNRERIKNEYLNDPRVKYEIIKESFIYLARHEYCHSLRCNSSSILKNFTEDQLGKIRNSTKFNYYIMENKFSEYYSDYYVYRHFSNIPELYFQKVLNILSMRNIDFDCMGMFPFREDTFNTSSQVFLYHYLQNLYRFHLCNRWNLILPFFQEVNRPNIIKLIYLIFEQFKNIIRRFSNFPERRDALFKLIDFLDKNDFKELNLNDILNSCEGFCQI